MAAIVCSGASLSIGDLSFNDLIPASSPFPGVNGFEIDNFTGTFSLPPDFRVSEPLTFTNSKLTVQVAGGGSQVLMLGDLGPGSYDPASAMFATTTDITSGMFSAVLDRNSFTLADGSVFSVFSTAISIDLLPSAGISLVPGTDSAVITLAGTTGVATPEPPLTGVLLAVACLLAAASTVRRRPKARAVAEQRH